MDGGDTVSLGGMGIEKGKNTGLVPGLTSNQQTHLRNISAPTAKLSSRTQRSSSQNPRSGFPVRSKSQRDFMLLTKLTSSQGKEKGGLGKPVTVLTHPLR